VTESGIDTLEELLGDPRQKWDDLKQRVQIDGVKLYANVQAEWLDLMWTMDGYRKAGVPPRSLGDSSCADKNKRLDAVNRMKGNWFATLLSLLLENQTAYRLAPCQRVRGFSQWHQIDVAWPAGDIPLVCLETKVTGAAPSLKTTERAATADWTNRRKELKFAATDLKLYRRENLQAIQHWDVWRAKSAPKCYFLWGARLSGRDDIASMAAEVENLTQTYLEGAGITAWREGAGGYVPVKVPSRAASIDDVLYRIATEINDMEARGLTSVAAEDREGWASGG
jgi:hypothetical protein